MQIKLDNEYFVTVFNMAGVYAGSGGFPDQASAKKFAAQTISQQKVGSAVVFKRLTSCQLPTPAVEWSDSK